MVTGSSRGLGKSIATEIGSLGHKIIVNYVSDGSKEAAQQTVDEIKAAGGDAVAIQADCKSCSLCLCLCARVSTRIRAGLLVSVLGDIADSFIKLIDYY